MSEAVYERIKKNLEILNMKNTSLILDNYLEKAIHDKTNIVEILDYLLDEEAKTKKNRAVENQIKMSGFPYRKFPLQVPSIFHSAPPSSLQNVPPTP